MTVRTRVLSHGNQSVPSGAARSLFVCPTDRTAIAKDIRISAYGPAVAQPIQLLAALSGFTVPVGLRLIQIGSGSWHAEQAFVVLQEGEELGVYNAGTVAVDLTYHISGALLLGDPA